MAGYYIDLQAPDGAAREQSQQIITDTVEGDLRFAGADDKTDNSRHKPATPCTPKKIVIQAIKERADDPDWALANRRDTRLIPPLLKKI